jgi:hypothetical protein
MVVNDLFGLHRFTHKVHVTFIAKLLFKQIFGLVGGAEIFEIIHVKTNVDRREVISDFAIEYTRVVCIVWALFQAHLEEEFLDFGTSGGDSI